MIRDTVVTSVFQENCYVIGSEATKEAMIVDPGDEPNRILAALERMGLKVTLIAVTHSHIDHIGALQAVRTATGAPVAMHAITYEETQRQPEWASRWGVSVQKPPIAAPEIIIEEGSHLAVGGMVFRTLFCPGHTRGHICLYGEGVVLTGDVLFHGSIGRFDLPGGDGRLLLTNIRDKLLTLPDETVVLPGHGPATTIGQEKLTNPYIRLIDSILAGEIAI